MGGLRPGSGSVLEIREMSYDQVWNAVVKVAGEQLTVVETDKANGVLKAEGGIEWTSWGEVVGIFVTPAGTESDKYRVEVVSKKRSKLQITGTNWETPVIEGIKAELGI
jgi:hypothetical protein